MQSLLVQGCSKSKNDPKGPVPALDLYSGYFFKIIKKAMREDEYDRTIDICVLSAEYGLINADTEITQYDRKMDSARASELGPDVRAELHKRTRDNYDTIVVNVGGAYREALDGITDIVEPDVHFIEGDGIGYKGQVLKQFIRGEKAVVTDKYDEKTIHQ